MKKEMKRLKELKAQDDLIKSPADKGSATVFENESNYITKEQDQINAMDVQQCHKLEKAIVRPVRTRLIRAFKEMGLFEK